MESSSQDKNLPATPQRLQKARDDGQVENYQDLSNLAVLGGGALVLMVLLPLGFAQLRAAFSELLRFDQRVLLQPQMMLEWLGSGVLNTLLLTLPVGLLVLLLAVGSQFVSGSWTLSSKPILPDLTRISPLAGLKRLFSRQQLVETIKLTGVAVVIGVVAWQFLAAHVASFGTLLLRPLESALGQLGVWMSLGVGLLLAVVAVFAVIDVPVQKFLHAHRMRMSHDEVRREYKEMEGDPFLKAQRRARQRELSQRNSVAAVPRADLVVMNPTHYAVAIRYDDASMNAPRVVAKGADLIALQIRDLAKAHDVPLLRSPMLARALYAHAEIDQEIPAALYTAVAQVLAYVYQVKAALKGQAVMPAAMPLPQVPPELDPDWVRKAGP